MAGLLVIFKRKFRMRRTMSSRTYRSLSLANEVSRLENEWKAIKTNQVYGLSQYRVFHIYGSKRANTGWTTVYDNNGNATSNKTPLFVLESISFKPLYEPAWTQWQMIFYDSDGVTEIDPTKVGCTCWVRGTTSRETGSSGAIATKVHYDFYNSTNKTLYVQPLIISTSDGYLSVSWTEGDNV